MTTLALPKVARHDAAVPPLHNGDCLSQAEFHRRYEAMPRGVKAELIEGIVYMASPVGVAHGDSHASLNALLVMYSAATPAARCSDNATVILSETSEPQPDLHLRILPEFGGRTRVVRGILNDAPELVAEVAHSSESVDLRAKRRDYERAGVLEYLVLLVREGALRAFDFSTAEERSVSADGIYRSKAFPGLWIDAAAVVRSDLTGAMRALNKGLKSPEHAAFNKRMSAALRGGQPKRREQK